MTPEEIKKQTIEQFDKAIETLEEYIEENLTQEERDRRNWKFAGVQFIKSEVEDGQTDLGGKDESIRIY